MASELSRASGNAGVMGAPRTASDCGLRTSCNAASTHSCIASCQTSAEICSIDDALRRCSRAHFDSCPLKDTYPALCPSNATNKAGPCHLLNDNRFLEGEVRELYLDSLQKYTMSPGSNCCVIVELLDLANSALRIPLEKWSRVMAMRAVSRRATCLANEGRPSIKPCSANL